MNKTYSFPTESSGDYTITVDLVSSMKDLMIFNARIVPPKGHQLSLKNIKYSPDSGLHIPRGSGFSLNLSRRLREKFNKIIKDLHSVKERQNLIEAKQNTKEVPKMFDRYAVKQIKEELEAKRKK